jgi:hypothetical protein
MRAATDSAEPGATSQSRTRESDDTMMSTIISHAKVRMGNAHHTRLDAFDEVGGGGGGSMIGGAVGLVSLLTASMTVTEVTTRIAIVGIVVLLGLLTISRVGPGRTNQRASITVNPQRIQSPLVRTTQPIRRLTSVSALALIGAISGLALGVLASLTLATILNTMNRGV